MEPQDESEAYSETLEAVEGLAARLAATNFSEEQVRALHDLCPSGCGGDDEDATLAYARGLVVRRHLLEHCGNPLLRNLAEQLRMMAESGPRVPTYPIASVVDAVARRDPQQAEEHMRRYVREMDQATRPDSLRGDISIRDNQESACGEH